MVFLILKMKKILFDQKSKTSKIIKLIEPSNIKCLSNKLALDILKLLLKESSYPNLIAKKLGVHEQKVYYYIRQLQRAGLIVPIKEEKRHGAVCQYFGLAAPSFGFEIPGGKSTKLDLEDDQKLRDFFYEFIKDGVFDGTIVVGAPEQHGPYLTSSRDSHYAVQLAMLLGNFCKLPNKFVVKLDTETKAENAIDRNLIIIGGPVTNIIAQELNERLEVKFKWQKAWQFYTNRTKKVLAGEDLGLIAKIKSPWSNLKSVILLAGLKFEGTKACILALTSYYNKILQNFKPQKDYYAIIRGLDKDGDGKTDNIELVEEFSI